MVGRICVVRSLRRGSVHLWIVIHLVLVVLWWWRLAVLNAWLESLISIHWTGFVALWRIIIGAA